MLGRKNTRLKQYDYTSAGYYFVTVVTKLRQNLFSGKENIVIKELNDLKTKTPGIDLDYFVVMPNHVHIILILQNCPLHLGEIVRRFKAKASHTFRQNIWQANYYEHSLLESRPFK